MKVTIFVEGGGDGPATIAECRRGFATFFGRMLPDRKAVKIVPCGSRSQAFNDYRTALQEREPDEAVILLVDSEAPISPKTDAWDHLAGREGDKWDKPDVTVHDDVHLMVQCVEAWFLTDHDALKIHYKKGIHLKKLASLVNGDVELIAKSRILSSLKAALRQTDYESYNKCDAFKIIGELDPGNRSRLGGDEGRRWAA